MNIQVDCLNMCVCVRACVRVCVCVQVKVKVSQHTFKKIPTQILFLFCGRLEYEMPNVNGILDKQYMQRHDKYRHALRNVVRNTKMIKSQETKIRQRYDRMRTQICAKGVETKTKITQKTSEDGRHNTTIKKLQPNPQTQIAIHQVDKKKYV